MLRVVTNNLERENAMIKKTLTLIIMSSLISAGLLLLGTTVMANFSPALAPSQNALVAGPEVQTSSVSIPAEQSVSQKIELQNVAEKPEMSSVANAALPSSANVDQQLSLSIATTPGAAPVTGVTIAQILANPDQYYHTEITITGIVTGLSHEKFLLNDGTGQILVEVDDDLVTYVIIDGLSITVTGKLDDSNAQYGIELDACTITDENGTVVVDDCMDEDIIDDLDDDCIDDLDDDCVGCDDCADCGDSPDTDDSNDSNDSDDSNDSNDSDDSDDCVDCADGDDD
jgi:uncharacterized protein YdeI (BOF family)